MQKRRAWVNTCPITTVRIRSIMSVRRVVVMTILRGYIRRTRVRSPGVVAGPVVATILRDQAWRSSCAANASQEAALFRLLSVFLGARGPSCSCRGRRVAPHWREARTTETPRRSVLSPTPVAGVGWTALTSRQAVPYHPNTFDTNPCLCRIAPKKLRTFAAKRAHMEFCGTLPRSPAVVVCPLFPCSGRAVFPRRSFPDEMVQEVRHFLSLVSVPQHRAQVLGLPARDILGFGPVHQSETLRGVFRRECSASIVRGRTPAAAGHPFVGASLLSFEWASVMGATPSEVSYVMALVPQVSGLWRLCRHGSLSAEVGACPPAPPNTVVRPSHLSGISGNRCIVNASCFRALRDGCSCGSGGGGPPSTHPGSGKRTFYARSLVCQSLLRVATLVVDSRFREAGSKGS